MAIMSKDYGIGQAIGPKAAGEAKLGCKKTDGKA